MRLRAGPPVLDTDAALVARAREGDEDAFELLYRRHRRVVHGVLLSRVPPREVADALQEAFTRALAKLPSLRDPAQFGPWVVTIARNLSVDLLRRPTFEVVDDPLGATAPMADALAVLELIRQLPEAYRETLVLRLVEGLTGAEIAVATGKTEGSVRVNLHRGMTRLRARLRDPEMQ